MGANVYINEDEKEALRKAADLCRGFLEGTFDEDVWDKFGGVPEDLDGILRKVNKSKS